MNTKILLKEFKEMLGREERAKYFYDHYIDCIDDEEIKNKLKSIRDDEIKHIKVVKKLIDLVS